jgi:amino acid adenylation domain-containing protein
MTTDAFLSHLRSLGVELWADGGSLRCNGPRTVLTPELQAEIKSRKSEILLRMREANCTSAQPRLHPVARNGNIPLSLTQQRLWFLDQLDLGSPVFNIATAVRLVGPLDVGALEQSINEIVRRHEALRTTFAPADEQPVVVIAPSLTIALQLVDLRELSESERPLQAQRLMGEEAKYAFNLARGPLLRAALLRLGLEDHILIVTVHHIVFDGWSVVLFSQELAVLYSAFSQGNASPLPELPIQYTDFAHWQRQWLQGEVLQAQLGYWKTQLAGAPPALELPTDRVRPAVQSFHGAREFLDLPKSLSKALKGLSRQEGVTLFMTLLAAFKVLLFRHTGQEDIVVGTPTAGRNRAEIERLIGFFINTLVLRTDLSGNPSFRELLRRVREVTLGAYDHQDVPFEKLVEELQPQRDLSRTPLFQVFFNMLNLERRSPELHGLRVTDEQLVLFEFAKFDLTFYVREQDEEIHITVVYNTDLFDAATVNWMLGHYRTLLTNVVAKPDYSISTIPLLTAEERQRLSIRSNRIRATNAFIEFRKEDIEQSIPSRFEQQAEKYPERLAVKTKNYQWTYRRLDRIANGIAQSLLKPGNRSNARVALLFNHDAPMIAGILGALKAGKTYVPLDPAYPMERLAYMVEDSQCVAILTDRLNLDFAQTLTAETLKIINIDDAQNLDSPSKPDVVISPDTLAYILYTSGSTGWPKGVMQSHRNVLHHVKCYTNSLHVNSDDKLTLLSSYSFDAAVMDIFGGILNGAVLFPIDMRNEDPIDVIRWIGEERLTIYHSTPTTFRYLLGSANGEADLSSIRFVVMGGEEVQRKDVLLFLSHFSDHSIFVNGLGPSESTLALQYFISHTQQTTSHIVPVGYPVEDTQVRLLNDAGDESELYGEIAIRSAHVALGYWRRPEITTNAFLAHPEDGWKRTYRTGDMGRLLPDGSIAFVGRKDHQVKLRGFRIELGDIESVLSQHPAVKEAVVLAREDVPGDKRLVSYVVPDRGSIPNIAELRSFLQARLPDYMIPAAFVSLEAMPLSPNGKIDRKALPAPERSASDEAAYIAPRTRTEEILAGIWAEFLGVERVGINDNFFELGGHSLLVMRVIDRMRRAGLQANVRTFFSLPTIAAVAIAVDDESDVVEVPANLIPTGCGAISPEMLPLVELNPEQIERVVRAVPGGSANVQDIYPLAPLQEGILFHHLMAREGDPYLLRALFCFDTRARLETYLEALQGVINRNDILRTAVLWEGLVEPVQVVWRHAVLRVEEVSLNHGGADVAEQLRARFDPRHYRLDVREAPLLRVFIAEDAANARWVMLLLFHHLAIDHTALEVMQQEVQAYVLGRGGQLPTPLPFRNFVAQARLGVPREEHEVFFREFLGNVDEPTTPFGLTDVNGGSAISEARRPVDPSVGRRLRERARALGVTVASICHLAWAQVLARTSGRDDVVFGTVLFGRMQGGEGVDRMLGLFINTLPVRIRVGEEGVQESVRQVHAQLARLLRHEHASLALAQRCSAVAAPTPLFSSLLNYRYSAPAAQVSSEARQAWEGMEVLGGEGRTNYPFVLLVDDLGESFALTAQVQSPVDPARVCTFMHTALEQVVMALEIAPATPMRGLDVLPEVECRQVVEKWNMTRREYGCTTRLHRLIEQQAAQTPESIALEFNGQELNYSELNRRANQLARVLRARGVGADVLVGVFAERSFEMVVALLAVLKAGGAYVPLDPSYPAKRLAHMLEDARVRVVLAQPHLAGRLPNQTGEVFMLDGSWEAYASAASEDLEDLGTPQDLAYVIFTSGSTGRPKGAMNTHEGISNRLLWMQEAYPLTKADRVLQKTPFSFDVSVWEFFWPLMTGARLVIARPEGHRDSAYLVLLIEESRITTLHFVPSMLQVFLEEPGVEGCSSLKRVICSGEALPVRVQERFFGRLPGVELHNLYGPTEAAVDVTCWACKRGSVGLTVPIGRPIANTQLYILDPHLRPVPIGVAGELHIGGVGLARGYVNRPELTNQKFISNPFSSEPGSRLYKTGDFARYLPDGNIEFLGRIDHQVKLRGFRIELGEIESVLSQHPAVKEAVVLAREDAPGDQRLVAYVVPDQKSVPTIADFRSLLQARLPDYMIPAAFIFLEALPLSPNGKIDRKLLPPPDQSALQTSTHFIAPRSPAEESVADIWAQVLKLEHVGAYDNFFELGGHSLLAAQVVFRARKIFGVELPLATFFEAPTVEAMAAIILRAQNGTSREATSGEAMIDRESRPDSGAELPVIVPSPGEKYTPFPLTDVQQAYWIGRSGAFELGNVATHGYMELDCAGLNVERLNTAWNRLIERHEMLRAVVLPDGQQQILKWVPPHQIEVLDLRRQSGQEKVAILDGIREQMSHQVFQPDHWPLFSLRASQTEDGLFRLHISRDVLMVDGWSWSILTRELCSLYQDIYAILPPLEISFRDYVLAEIAVRESEQYRRSKEYWWNRLDIMLPAPELPLVKDPGAVTSPRFVRRAAQLEPDRWLSLKRRAIALGLSPTGAVLAAFAEVLKTWSKSPRFTVNLTLLNRLPLHPQVNDIVGDFTSLTLLAVDNSSESTFDVRAQRLQKQLWQDLDHRYVSGIEIMREIARRRRRVDGAMMPVVFTSMLGQDASNALSNKLGKVVYGINQTSQVWLDHQVLEQNGALLFCWDVVDELFPAGMLDDMFDSYCALLRRLADDENAWRETGSETARKLLPWRQLEQRAEVNDTASSISDDLLHTLFAAQMVQRPQQPAVISSERTLTYEELDRRANQVGHWLRQNGARRNHLVAVVMEKGWEQVVGVLGVLASGAAYLPIDAGLPKERLWHLLQHGEVELVLTQPEFDRKIEWPQSVKRLTIEDDSLSGLSDQSLDPMQSSEDIAYVIYTSGSTGLPKGVVIDHRGAVNTILDLNQRFSLTSKDRVLALSSLSFDLSVYDVFGILAAGGTIVVPDAEGLRDPAHWADLVARHRVTLWNSVPALMEMLVEYLEGRKQRLARELRLVLMSGDWIPVALPERIWAALDRDVEIISMGGATEASIWSIIYPIEKVDPSWKSIPYGRPMVNQTFHVLNAEMEPCPFWVSGQLFIGGIGLAEGYWRDEEKTRASFITHPRTGERLYRTGDQGRYLPDGNIEFLGREDDQVKVQGYRVELGEIETVLGQHPKVRSAIVTALGAAFGSRRLVAHVVPKHEPPPAASELMQFLKNRLPEYMLPSAYVMLDQLPLSPNGKVDRRALPEPATFNAERVEKLPTQKTSQTTRIACLVAEVLKVGHVDPDVNLLDLGATSIDMIKIVNSIERELGFRPKIEVFYRVPTVATLTDSYEVHLCEHLPSQDSLTAMTEGDYEEGHL